jgi:hypothetical protein
VLPTHTGLGEAVAVTFLGRVITLTKGVDTGVADPHEFLTVKVYTPAPANVIFIITGFCRFDVNPLGPVQLQEVALVALPVNVKVPPSHIGLGVAVAVTEPGRESTTTGSVDPAEGCPQELPAFNVYTPAPAGVILTITGFCTVEVKPFGSARSNSRRWRQVHHRSNRAYFLHKQD